MIIIISSQVRYFFEKNKTDTIILIAVNFLIAFFSYESSILVKSFFNNGQKNTGQEFLSLIIIFTIIFCFNLIDSFFGYRVVYKGLLSLRKKMIEKIYKTDYKYLTENNPNGMWSETNFATNQVCGFYKGAFVSTPLNIMQFFVYGYIVFSTSLTAGIVSLAFLPLMVFMTWFVSKKSSHYNNEMMANFRKMGMEATDSFNNLKMIKAKNSYDFFINRFETEHVKFNKNMINYGFLNNYFDFFMSFVTSLVPLTVVFFMNNNKPGSGDIIVLYSFIPLFYSSFRALYGRVVSFVGIKPVIQKIDRILNLKDETSNAGIKELNSFDIKTESLKYSFGEKTIKIPDFEIKKGEKALICGESGIGKSTFFNIITGFSKEYEGNVYLGAHEIRKININTLRDKVGIVFQDNPVFNGTIHENILMGFEDSKLDNVIKTARFDKKLYEIGEKHINIDKMSGGEKARMQLCQTLIRNPEIILIDESFSSVDSEMEKNIISRVISDYKESTVIVISHRETTKEYFDKVINFS